MDDLVFGELTLAPEAAAGTLRVHPFGQVRAVVAAQVRLDHRGVGCDVRVAALGPSRVGWTVETFETHQDEWFWDLDVFAFEGRRITRVANTATGRQVPDSDDVSDLDSGITATTTLLRFDPSAVDGGFYRMTGERVVRRSDARPERVVRRRPVSVAYRTDRRAYPAVSLR